MDALYTFFKVTRKELNNMVEWKEGAPVAEFWEMFDRASIEADELEAKEICEEMSNSVEDDLRQMH